MGELVMIAVLVFLVWVVIKSFSFGRFLADPRTHQELRIRKINRRMEEEREAQRRAEGES